MSASRGMVNIRPATIIRRITKGDPAEESGPIPSRRLSYELTVIQEPQRARACGSGAKSSADRRPVDPPPVVQLQIFEHDGDSRADITFAYGANFFLFATLETARPMAHGRGQPAAASVPVLTGMPVSGMAYLDRPSEAGYFIFPDLSVRHEGKYRLSFNLYEQTKRKGDTDAEPASEDRKLAFPDAPESSFDWRMEVKSEIFTVFSAKKFPGLHESTLLSRTVAEQGCRVRIRRDVRMRRRETKDGRDFDEIDGEYARTPHTPSVHESYSRSRSNSIGSDDGGMSRHSAEYGGPPPPGGNLSFGYTDAAGPARFAQPLPPNPASYQHIPSPYHPGAQYSQPAPQQASYFSERYSERQVERQPQHPQSAYASIPPREREPEQYRRASLTPNYSSVSAPASYHAAFPPVESRYRHPAAYADYPPRPLSPPLHSPSSTLPPLRGLSDSKFSATSPLEMPPMRQMVRALSPTREGGPERPGSYGQYVPPTPYSPEATRKRNFGQVFSHSTEPLYNGMRPSADIVDDSEEASNYKMVYKRADGAFVDRHLPVSE